MSYVVLTSALIVPRARVVNKIIPMCLEKSSGSEFILTQFPIAIGGLKETTLCFYKYNRTVIMNNTILQTIVQTLGEIPLKYAITVNTASVDVYDLERIFEDFNLRKVTTLKVSNIRELIREIVTILTTKYRTYEIRPVAHYLIYDKTNKILTRVCWIDGIKSDVELYMGKNITLLVTDSLLINEKFVDKVDVDYIENYSPINVPELIEKVAEMDKLMDYWIKEISKIRRNEAKKRALQLLGIESEEGSETRVETHIETIEEKKEESETESRVET